MKKNCFEIISVFYFMCNHWWCHICLCVLFGVLTSQCLDLENFISRVQAHLHSMYVKVRYQGHGFKVKVTPAQINACLWVVCLWLTGNVLVTDNTITIRHKAMNAVIPSLVLWTISWSASSGMRVFLSSESQSSTPSSSSAPRVAYTHHYHHH